MRTFTVSVFKILLLIRSIKLMLILDTYQLDHWLMCSGYSIPSIPLVSSTLLLVCVLCFDVLFTGTKISLYCPHYPGTHFGGQTVLKCVEILLCQPPEYLTAEVFHHTHLLTVNTSSQNCSNFTYETNFSLKVMNSFCK